MVDVNDTLIVMKTKFSKVDVSEVECKSSANFKRVVGKSEFKVVFRKADGCRRVMLATVDVSVAASAGHAPKGTGVASDDSTWIRVFDLEKQDWRSFKSDSILELWLPATRIKKPASKKTVSKKRAAS